MAQITRHVTHTLDQEPDTIAVPKFQPDCVIIGTYHLQDKEDHQPTSSRVGSLQVCQNLADEGLLEVTARIDFEFGVYDIRFHPLYERLLGVATSDNEILLYWCQNAKQSGGSSFSIHMIQVGKIVVEELDDEESKPIITQFRFVDRPNSYGSVTDTEFTNKISIIATTQLGNTKFIEMKLRNTGRDSMGTENFRQLDFTITQIHKQSMDLEAWTVVSIPINDDRHLIISGGDDSKMIGTMCDISDNEAAITSCFTDTRTHQAGVVSLLLLASFKTNMHHEQNQQILLLSGSYDETMRLFTMHSDSISMTRPLMVAELKLPGGVWRVDLIDSYQIQSSNNDQESEVEEAETVRDNYILLVSAHLGGAFIVRLEVNTDGNQEVFSFSIEAEFTIGHESLVYACAGLPSRRTRDDHKQHSIISTSFYDRKVCKWEWIDEKAPS